MLQQNANEGCNSYAKARVLSTVTKYGRDAELLPGERVSWPASPPEPAPITIRSRGILGGDGDRPELAAVSSNDDGAVGGGG